MILLILESIGTSELLIIGIVALIFLGPRRMPEIARKIGKIMSEFRGTANEFKQTWKNEVDFEEEAKALDLNALESEAVARKPSRLPSGSPESAGKAEMSAPTIKEMDLAEFETLKANALSSKGDLGDTDPATATDVSDSDGDKGNGSSTGKETWL